MVNKYYGSYLRFSPFTLKLLVFLIPWLYRFTSTNMNAIQQKDSNLTKTILSQHNESLIYAENQL